jgi:hypothetical protein
MLDHLKIWKRVIHPLKKAPMFPPGQDRQGGSLSALLPLILFFYLDSSATAAHIALAIAAVAACSSNSTARSNRLSRHCKCLRRFRCSYYNRHRFPA